MATPIGPLVNAVKLSGLSLRPGSVGPSCGDGMVNQPSEECDSPDDAACPGSPIVGMGVGYCQANCTCCGEATPPGFPDVADVINCLQTSTCNPQCDVNGDGCCTYADLEAVLCLFRSGLNCCDPSPVPPPPTGIPGRFDRVRFITFVPASSPTAARFYAIRVQMTSLHQVIPPYTGAPSIPFTDLQGMVQWVGPPQTFLNCRGQSYQASFLQCTPYYDSAWTGGGPLEVTGPAIAPSSQYDVETVAADDCSGPGAASLSLTLRTTRWGDVAPLFNPPSATVQPDFDDISAMLNYFKCVGSGAGLEDPRFRLASVDAFGSINLSVPMNFGDISWCVDALTGDSYYPDFKPGHCSGSPTTACIADADCVGTDPCILCP